MNTQSTVTSWGVLLAIGAGGYWYYSRRRRHRRADSRKAIPPDNDMGPRRHVDAKSKRGRDRNIAGRETDSLSNDAARNSSHESHGNSSRQRAKGSRKTLPYEQSRSVSRPGSSTVEAASRAPQLLASNDGEEAINNTELARRMENAKTGTAFKASAKPKERVRTVKQSELGKNVSRTADGDVGASTTSSTGPEMDGDLSLANSPALGAVTPPTDSTDVGGVTDMLEPPTAKPLILRLTEAEQPARVPQSRPRKPVQEAPTKKQRQRKAKNEARKAELAEQEKERRQLMEKQMRTAREAEGRSPRNGGGWKYGIGPAPSIWSQGSKQPDTNSTVAVNAPLLDTVNNVTGETPAPFQGVENSMNGDMNEKHDAAEATGHQGSQHLGGTDASAVPTTTWGHDYPSEEEQLRLIQEQQSDEQWTTVATKKGAKKTKAQVPDDEKVH